MTPIDRTSDRPAYQQIADELRAKILSGDLTEGTKLPSERELSEKYSAARVTVRQGIAVLRNEGLVTAEHGRGIFVRQRRRIQRNTPHRLTPQAREANRSAFTGDTTLTDYRPTVQTRIDRAPAGDRIAEILGIQPTDQVLLRDRIMSADDEPVQLATSYYDQRLVRGTAIEETDTGTGGVHARLTDLGREPIRFSETIVVTMPNPEVARRLHLDGGTPVINITRIAYDSQDQGIELTDMTLAADRYELTYEFTS